MNYGTKDVEMTIGKETTGTALFRITWQVGEVQKIVLRPGKMFTVLFLISRVVICGTSRPGGRRRLSGEGTPSV